MFVLLSSSSPFFIIVTSHPIICALQTFLVALSMSLFFDSIIQNYFTGIKIVYINYGFFLQLPISILENTAWGLIFSVNTRNVLETYYNLNKCIPVWSIDKCQLFHKELSTQWKSFLKTVCWMIINVQSILFLFSLKGGSMSKFWCSAKVLNGQ